MAVRARRNENLNVASSRVSASVVSPSSTRSRPLDFFLCRGNMSRRWFLLYALIALCIYFSAYITWKNTSSQESIPRFYSFDIVNEFPHDPLAFTQGLLYGGNGTLLESTGMHGMSSVRKVNLQSGKVELSYKMDDSLFGEGLTVFGDRLHQVTWLTRTGFTYDRYNLSQIGTFSHPMKDGWGLATDGKVIFGSDGSSTLYQLDPVTWKAIKKTTVKYKDREIPSLNELEYVNGEILANAWPADCIARIAPDNGSVLSWILLHELKLNLLKSGHESMEALMGAQATARGQKSEVGGSSKIVEINTGRGSPCSFTTQNVPRLLKSPNYMSEASPRLHIRAYTLCKAKGGAEARVRMSEMLEGDVGGKGDGSPPS